MIKGQLSGHQFKEVYEKLGVNLDDMGCVMLDLEPITMDTSEVPLYFAKDKKKFWIKGWVAENNPHITLLYGLLKSGKKWEPHIERVLRDWEGKMKTVEVEDVGYFDSPYKDEPYYCIVAHIKQTPELIEGHQRLEFLPHINSHAGYLPHFTLAYIQKDSSVRDELIRDLKKELVGKKIKVIGLNLGDKK